MLAFAASSQAPHPLTFASCLADTLGQGIACRFQLNEQGIEHLRIVAEDAAGAGDLHSPEPGEGLFASYCYP